MTNHTRRLRAAGQASCYDHQYGISLCDNMYEPKQTITKSGMMPLAQGDPPAESRQPPGTESIALRAFSIIELIAKHGTPLSLEEVSQKLALPKPTAFRILSLLHTASILQRHPVSRRYTIGPRLFLLGLDLWPSSMQTQWHAALQEAVDALDETCNLTILHGNEVLYLDRVETSQTLRLHLEPGTRVPLHCTASGKLFLSQMSPAQRRKLLGNGPLTRYTAHTITDLDALDAAVDIVRHTGVGTHDGELFEDSVAIAVPINDQAGRLHAALAVHAPSSRASIESCLAHLPILRAAADKIATSLIPIHNGHA